MSYNELIDLISIEDKYYFNFIFKLKLNFVSGTRSSQNEVEWE